MNHWLFQIVDRKDNYRLTIYENGLVYGNERGKKLFILKPDTLDEIKRLINDNIYMFKQLGYYNGHNNNYALIIYTNTRKHEYVKVVGWSQLKQIISLLLNSNNHLKEFAK